MPSSYIHRVNELVPEEHDVVIVTSRPGDGGGRAFALEAPEGLALPSLPDDLTRESELVTHMREAGFRLTMVGGGSRSDEVRRFYFRPP